MVAKKGTLSQNWNWSLATSMYSGFENLYLRVEMNLGLISKANDFTSSTTSLRSASVYPENYFISFVQQLIFFNYFAEESYLQLRVDLV